MLIYNLGANNCHGQKNNDVFKDIFNNLVVWTYKFIQIHNVFTEYMMHGFQKNTNGFIKEEDDIIVLHFYIYPTPRQYR